MDFLDVEVMLFHTCNYNCGFCGFVTGGTVGYIADLEPFRDRGYIDSVVSFFRRHSTEDYRWNLLLSGGEPLLTPNLSYLSEQLIGDGHKIRYNTNLSLPIERDEAWLAANPPAAVDVIMVSLHPESLENYDTIVRRMETLKSLGYKIIARTVGHPLLLDQLERLDRDMAAMGISFTPIPMFSSRYPDAYTPEQRSALTRHIKSFGQMIQLEGGLDVSGHLCHAGSRLFALGLGRTGKGDFYRCVSTAATGGYLGNIFQDEKIDFLPRPVYCTRPDKICSCSFHFESNAVIGAEDGQNYEQLKNGTATNAAERFAAFVNDNNLKFAPKRREPSMGTEIGDKILIYRPQFVLDTLLGSERQSVFELGTAETDLLRPYKEGVTISREAAQVRVRAPATHGGGVQLSIPVPNRNRACLTFDGRVRSGNATIAVYSGAKAHFWHIIPKFRGSNVVTEAFTPEQDEVTVYVYSDEPVEFGFERIELVQTSAEVVTGQV